MEQTQNQENKKDKDAYIRFLNKLVLIKLNSAYTHVGTVIEVSDDCIILEDDRKKMQFLIKKSEISKIELRIGSGFGGRENGREY